MDTWRHRVDRNIDMKDSIDVGEAVNSVHVQEEGRRCVCVVCVCVAALHSHVVV